MAVTPVERLNLYRSGGQIRRYHAFPTMRTQTIAEHSWGVATILMCVLDKGDLTTNLLMAAMSHDVSEIATGDIPHQAKRDCIALKNAANQASTSFEVERGLRFPIDEFQMKALAWADLAEAIVWLMEDAIMGNRYAAANLREDPDILRIRVTPPTVRAAEMAKAIAQAIWSQHFPNVLGTYWPAPIGFLKPTAGLAEPPEKHRPIMPGDAS